MLDEIGLFDESLFLYGDDAELGLRGRLAGWTCAFAPRAVAYHRYSRTAGAHSSLKAFYVERNRVLVLLKLFPAPLVAVSPAYTAARLILQGWGALTGARRRGPAGRAAVAAAPAVVTRGPTRPPSRGPAHAARRRPCGRCGGCPRPFSCAPPRVPSHRPEAPSRTDLGDQRS